jgi:hypothetical protein
MAAELPARLADGGDRLFYTQVGEPVTRRVSIPSVCTKPILMANGIRIEYKLEIG